MREQGRRSGRGQGPDGPAALLVAHPGHELRLHRWLEIRRPVVFVLTDGSGGSRAPRLQSTARVLHRCGAVPGSIFGRFTDADLYSVILKGEVTTLRRLVEELCEQLVLMNASMAVGDGVEGYNPSHDLCQYLLRAAGRLACERTGAPMECFEFPVVGPPDTRDGSIVIRLDEAALERKLAAARDYASLADEVETAVAQYGRESFAVECLRISDGRRDEARLSRETPFYETHGEKRVAAGHYATVIRYADHFRPLVRALDGLHP